MQRSARIDIVSAGLTAKARGTMAPSTTISPSITVSVEPEGIRTNISV